jgi:hypothetical protein
MTGVKSPRLTKAVIVLLSTMLAAWFIVGCITTQVAPLAPHPSTWHTVPVKRGDSVAYITPPEAWILRISPYGVVLAILLAVLVAGSRKQKKAHG